MAAESACGEVILQSQTLLPYMPERMHYLTPALVICLLIFHLPSFAQIPIEGRVADKNDRPIPYASVRLLRDNTGCITDSAGNFMLRIRGHKKKDTLAISSVGYETLKIPFSGNGMKGPFRLIAYSKRMEPVVVKAFSKEGLTGSKTDNVGYFRGWNPDNKGGEIGKEIAIPYKEYQLSKVRFKIYSPCDTLMIRLRIRDMNMDLPGAELVGDSIAKVFVNPAVADKFYEFDLLKYNIILTKSRLFISFEIIKAGNGETECSIAFAGSEQGEFQYKSAAKKDWYTTHDFAIYTKLFVMHNED